MNTTLNLQDLMQWGAFAALIGTVWFQLRQRDTDREEVTKWRTNMERDVEAVNTKLDREGAAINTRLERHEAHDNRLFDRLDTIAEALNGVSERLVRIESHMNGG